jgi:hypothetical protein
LIGALLADFVSSRIENGVEALGHCARALSALERLGPFPAERVGSIMHTWVARHEEEAEYMLRVLAGCSKARLRWYSASLRVRDRLCSF